MTFRALRHAVIRALGGTTDMAPAVIDYRKGPPVEPRRVAGLGMTDQDIADATPPEPSVSAYAMPKSPPWLPSSAGGIAMDSAGMPPALTAASLYAWAGNGAFGEGLGFLGYPYLAELTQRPEYRRVSEIWAAEAVRKWIEFKGEGDRIKKIQKSLERLKVRDVIRHAIELDGFMGRAQIFPDLGYHDNDGELRAIFVPKAKVGVGKLKGFTVIEPFWSYPGSYQSTNPLASDFYKPREWYVMGKIVDSSWLITIVGRPMPDLLKPAYAFGGLAQSQMVKPYVDNWLRTRQSVSDLIHSFSTMVLKTNMATIIQGALGGAKKLLDRIRLFNRGRDNRGLMAIDKDTEELENVSTPLGTLDKLQAQAQEQIASVAGIPLVVLLGVTPSGLNASSDGEIRTFYATIDGYLSRVIKHPLQYIIDLVQLDLDGTIDPDLTWDFIPLWETPEAEKANIRKADAETDIAYCAAGVISNENVRTRITTDPESIYYGMTLEEGEPPADPTLEDDLDEEDDQEDADGGGEPGKPKGGVTLPKLPAQDAQPGEFDEGKHPRAPDGKFGSGAGGGGAPAEKPKGAVAPAVQSILGDEGVTRLRELIADKQSKAADIMAVLKPLDEVGHNMTPTLPHDTTPTDSFWQGRTYSVDGKPATIQEVGEHLAATAEHYAGPGGVKQQRRARILLGPPAAGKSTSAEEIARQGGYAIVDGDDAKKVIPEFEGGVGASAVHEESSYMAEAVLADQLKTGNNVILPLVGGKPGSIEKRIKVLRDAGYDVTVDLVDVNEDEAARRMAGRAMRTGRHISSSYFASIGNGPLNTYNYLKDKNPDLGFGRINGNGGHKEERYEEASNHPDATPGKSLFGGS
jgi:phage-related protein (TIGR01555 family)